MNIVLDVLSAAVLFYVLFLLWRIQQVMGSAFGERMRRSYALQEETVELLRDIRNNTLRAGNNPKDGRA